jgi:hypothetical protein
MRRVAAPPAPVARTSIETGPAASFTVELSSSPEALASFRRLWLEPLGFVSVLLEI